MVVPSRERIQSFKLAVSAHKKRVLRRTYRFTQRVVKLSGGNWNAHLNSLLPRKEGSRRGRDLHTFYAVRTSPFAR